MTESNQKYSIRKMLAEDLLQIAAIERQATASPWSRRQFEECQEQHCCLVMAAENNPKLILGYAVVSTLLDQAEVLNICINPEYQSRGYGSQLLTELLKQLPDKVEVVYLEVRVSNFRAIRLYQNHGFIEVGQRRDYYPTEFGREDAILMNLVRQ
ncbi:MAG: ribosomal protein S18-alanine N-acetyltransferase [Porticoccaceae bacterium]